MNKIKIRLQTEQFIWCAMKQNICKCNDFLSDNSNGLFKLPNLSGCLFYI